MFGVTAFAPYCKGAHSDVIVNDSWWHAYQKEKVTSILFDKSLRTYRLTLVVYTTCVLFHLNQFPTSEHSLL